MVLGGLVVEVVEPEVEVGPLELTVLVGGVAGGLGFGFGFGLEEPGELEGLEELEELEELGPGELGFCLSASWRWRAL